MDAVFLFQLLHFDLYLLLQLSKLTLDFVHGRGQVFKVQAAILVRETLINTA